MIDAAWTLFVIASLVVILSPGQDMVLVLSHGMSRGWKAGMVTAAGVSVGLVGHTVLATAGLGALLRASETLFVVLKFAGAAYLAYLGLRLLLTRSAHLVLQTSAGSSLGRLFARGALSNLSNPKIALFYFAFLPQFIPAGAAHPTLSLFALGLGFAALTFVIKGPVGWGAGTLSAWIRSRPSVLVWMHRTSGAMLIALGVRLALSERP
jgi:threonine/homoserine/homoserine lactone efflux protein